MKKITMMMTVEFDEEIELKQIPEVMEQIANGVKSHIDSFGIAPIDSEAVTHKIVFTCEDTGHKEIIEYPILK